MNSMSCTIEEFIQLLDYYNLFAATRLPQPLLRQVPLEVFRLWHNQKNQEKSRRTSLPNIYHTILLDYAVMLSVPGMTSYSLKDILGPLVSIVYNEKSQNEQLSGILKEARTRTRMVGNNSSLPNSELQAIKILVGSYDLTNVFYLNEVSTRKNRDVVTFAICGNLSGTEVLEPLVITNLHAQLFNYFPSGLLNSYHLSSYFDKIERQLKQRSRQIVVICRNNVLFDVQRYENISFHFVHPKLDTHFGSEGLVFPIDSEAGLWIRKNLTDAFYMFANFTTPSIILSYLIKTFKICVLMLLQNPVYKKLLVKDYEGSFLKKVCNSSLTRHDLEKIQQILSKHYPFIPESYSFLPSSYQYSSLDIYYMFQDLKVYEKMLEKPIFDAHKILLLINRLIGPSAENHSRSYFYFRNIARFLSSIQKKSNYKQDDPPKEIIAASDHIKSLKKSFGIELSMKSGAPKLREFDKNLLQNSVRLVEGKIESLGEPYIESLIKKVINSLQQKYGASTQIVTWANAETEANADQNWEKCAEQNDNVGAINSEEKTHEHSSENEVVHDNGEGLNCSGSIQRDQSGPNNGEAVQTKESMNNSESICGDNMGSYQENEEYIQADHDEISDTHRGNIGSLDDIRHERAREDDIQVTRPETEHTGEIGNHYDGDFEDDTGVNEQDIPNGEEIPIGDDNNGEIGMYPNGDENGDDSRKGEYTNGEDIQNGDAIGDIPVGDANGEIYNGEFLYDLDTHADRDGDGNEIECHPNSDEVSQANEEATQTDEATETDEEASQTESWSNGNEIQGTASVSQLNGDDFWEGGDPVDINREAFNEDNLPHNRVGVLENEQYEEGYQNDEFMFQENEFETASDRSEANVEEDTGDSQKITNGLQGNRDTNEQRNADKAQEIESQPQEEENTLSQNESANGPQEDGILLGNDGYGSQGYVDTSSESSSPRWIKKSTIVERYRKLGLDFVMPDSYSEESEESDNSDDSIISIDEKQFKRARKMRKIHLSHQGASILSDDDFEEAIRISNRFSKTDLSCIYDNIKSPK